MLPRVSMPSWVSTASPPQVENAWSGAAGGAALGGAQCSLLLWEQPVPSCTAQRASAAHIKGSLRGVVRTGLQGAFQLQSRVLGIAAASAYFLAFSNIRFFFFFLKMSVLHELRCSGAQGALFISSPSPRTLLSRLLVQAVLHGLCASLQPPPLAAEPLVGSAVLQGAKAQGRGHRGCIAALLH